MKLLSPSPISAHTDDLFSGLISPPTFRPGFRSRTNRVASPRMEMVDEDSAKVYVAVGKSSEKSSALLQWCLRNFVDSEICILHVHQPSAYIPTLLGRLPASQANNEVVTAFRNEEWQVTRKLLTKYLNICTRSKVQASVVTTESEQIHKGIMDLVAKHNTKKLVIGAVPDCVKLKKSSAKASYVAKMAPPLCEIWFVNKGTLIWKKQSINIQPPNQEQSNPLFSRSMPSYLGNNILYTPECKRSNSARASSFTLKNQFLRVGGVGVDVASSITSLNNTRDDNHITSPVYFGSSGEYTSSGEPWISSDTIGKNEEEIFCEQVDELIKEAGRLKNEASTEILLRSKLEAEVVESIKEVKAFVSAHAQELELRKEAENTLKAAIQHQEKLIEESLDATHDLQHEMLSITVLDNRARESTRRYNELSMELNLTRVSIADIQQENQKIQRQKFEATVWLDHRKNREVSGIVELNGEGCNQLEEFSLLDLQGATCDFSESFKIGQGGYGVVYKGELLERTVAIKRLHPHNIHRQSEFYQQAQVLGRLRHPHLVSLIGVCPEAWSLVYDHIPNGTLQKRLFCTSNNKIPLIWKIRVRIIAEIASCLLFLHSLNQEEIVHGDLKPNNILLDSINNAKLCDYGISRLIPPDHHQLLRCPSFGRYSETRAFPYADPEFFRTGILTTKSDIFAFGLIILQMITGRNADGVVGYVRKSVSRGKTSTIVDSSGGEWSMFVVRRLVDLGLHCCEMNGKDRPEITPMLVRELEELYVLEDRPVPSFFLCPIFQEIMYDPQVAADGFTYEGEALREWLENGGETSPMTNLKLNDLTLTPNHSLRLAIKEWVYNLQLPPSS